MGEEGDPALGAGEAERAQPVDELEDEPESQNDDRRDLDQLVEETEEDERQDPRAGEQHEVRAKDRRDRPRGADHRDLGARVDRDLGKHGRDAAAEIEEQVAETPQSILDVVAEDPQVDEVPDDVDEVHVQEHAREDRQRLLT